ncbi:MAG: hypothetical protein CMJ31_12575 [Phycisphaerae bacterium]|nr:hypothetical protein [Phycisphaerae bacterium]
MKRASTNFALPAALTALAAATLIFAGCTDPLHRIDKKTRRLVELRSDELGRHTIAPTRTAPVPSFKDRRLNDTDPETTNPPPEELDYQTPSEPRTDRVVAERLAGYASYAIGAGPDASGATPPPPRPVNFNEALRVAQSTAPEYLFEEEAYVLDAIAVLSARNLFRPRFFNETSVQVAGFGREGNYDHVLDIINSLGLTKNLPSGGSIAATWIVRATDQLRETVSGGYVQSSELALSANIPLLRGAGAIARENLIQAERNLVYSARDFERSRRELLVQIANDYFGLLQQQSGIANIERQLAGLRQLAEQTAARVDAGRLEPFQRQLSANQVLTTEARLAGARESYTLALDNFKLRLGLPIEIPINILPLDFDLPEPAIELAEAADRSLAFRLDLQNQRDIVVDARRAVRNARNGLLPDLNIAGSVGIPTEANDPTGGLSIDAEDLNYSLSANLGLPLDRRAEHLAVRSSLILLERSERNLQVSNDRVIIESRQAVRQIDLARFQLELAERGVEINELRLEDLRLRDDTDPQRIVDAENELIAARNARDQARTDLRNAILNYLLDTGQLRVAKDGTLLRLPGMGGTAAASSDDAFPEDG